MGAFVYVVPSDPDNYGIIVCANMVLPMGWVDSPKFFCAFPEMLTDVVNALVNAYLPVPYYGAISGLPSTGTGPPHTHMSLNHIECYMDDMISTV